MLAVNIDIHDQPINDQTENIGNVEGSVSKVYVNFLINKLA